MGVMHDLCSPGLPLRTMLDGSGASHGRGHRRMRNPELCGQRWSVRVLSSTSSFPTGLKKGRIRTVSGISECLASLYRSGRLGSGPVYGGGRLSRGLAMKLWNCSQGACGNNDPSLYACS